MEFAGILFADHVYYLLATEADSTPLSAWIPVTRSSGGVFVYADLPCDDPPMESYLGTLTSRSLLLWLYDETDTDFVCYATATVLTAPIPAGLVRYSSVPALPTSPVAGSMYYLSASDSVAKCPIGIYVYANSSWSRAGGLDTPYSLGSASGVLTVVAVAGVTYAVPGAAGGSSLALTLPDGGSVRLLLTDCVELALPGAWEWQTGGGSPPTLKTSGVDYIRAERIGSVYMAWLEGTHAS